MVHEVSDGAPDELVELREIAKFARPIEVGELLQDVLHFGEHLHKSGAVSYVDAYRRTVRRDVHIAPP